MRVLWFSVTPSLFNARSNGHNGGGWIASLERIARQLPDVELGVAFHFDDGRFKCEDGGVTYYPIASRKRSPLSRLLKGDGEEERIGEYLRVVADFKPDLIQIFGSENDFGLICGRTSVPVVIHIQGCLPPYLNAIFPIGMNRYDFVFGRGLSMHYRYMGLRTESAFRKNANRETSIIRSCRYFMGRTEWDKGLVSLFNPTATYFHCEEALRDAFVCAPRRWQWQERDVAKIISVISAPWYKGADLILKTALLLKRHTSLRFEWNVYGVGNLRFYEKKYGIRATEVGVNVRGTASQETLMHELADASCYVHTSYIDNSPNSLCEAQIVGTPVLATHVGGISSLVRDGETGLLFPANDPYGLAGLIRRIATDRDAATALSRQEVAAAVRRHDPEAIGQRLLGIYRQILQDK